jgi:hypothetical protein
VNIMTKQTMPTSPLASAEPDPALWPAFPTETEIYILPDGHIIVADLPAALAGLLDLTQPTSTDEMTSTDGD